MAAPPLFILCSILSILAALFYIFLKKSKPKKPDRKKLKISRQNKTGHLNAVQMPGLSFFPCWLIITLQGL